MKLIIVTAFALATSSLACGGSGKDANAPSSDPSTTTPTGASTGAGGMGTSPDSSSIAARMHHNGDGSP